MPRVTGSAACSRAELSRLGGARNWVLLKMKASISCMWGRAGGQQRIPLN